MNNLKITTRLAISFVLLLAALLFLVHANYTNQQHEVTELENELHGVQYLRQVTEATEALSRYRISLFRIQSGEIGYEDTAAKEREKANQEMLQLGVMHEKYSDLLKFSPTDLLQRQRQSIAYAEINKLWQGIYALPYGDVIEDDYNQLFKRLTQLVEHVAETSGLMADSNLSSYALMDVVTKHVTEVIMRTLGTESMGYQAVVEERVGTRMEQLYSWDYGTFVKRDNLRLVKRGIENSRYYEIAETAELRGLDKQLEEALERYLKFGDAYANVRIDLGEGKIIDHQRYVESGLGFTAAMFDVWYLGAQKLDYLLTARLQQAHKVANTAVAITLGCVILAIGFFLYVARGIVTSLKDVELAMDRVANGELDMEVPHLQDQDEIGSMARSLERFRRSYWWLND